MKKLLVFLGIIAFIISCDALYTEQYADFSGSISEYDCDANSYKGVPNVEFKIYDIDDKLITTAKTDNNGVFIFNSNVNKQIRLLTETYDIDTIISANNLYNTFLNENSHIKDWKINDNSICINPECQIDDVIYYNNVIVDNGGVIFEQMNNILDNSVKKAKVRILNRDSTKVICEIKKKANLGTDEYWRILSIPSGTEYWFTIEEDTIFVMYDVYNEKVIGNELLVSFNDTIETVERCDYDDF
jgi:hypothetical protein